MTPISLLDVIKQIVSSLLKYDILFTIDSL